MSCYIMSSETGVYTREEIFDSLVELRNKADHVLIPINKKELKFESSFYSSTKENIWHAFINDQKIKKTSEYLFTYRCLTCNKLNTCASTQFLRKIRQCKAKCFQCNNITLNTTDFPSKVKIARIEKTYRELYEQSKIEFDTYPDQYKNSYLLSHLSEEDYARIRPKIISFGNGKYTNLDDYEYWPIYKVNNQMKFSYVIYDTINDTIFKTDQPIIKCDNCEKDWRCKSLEIFKNCYKILCRDCKLCNRIFKLRPVKNINNQIIMFQSKLELKFIEWCSIAGIVVTNGPNIEYFFNGKSRKYRVDFRIGDLLIEIKDFHIWHKNQVESGQWEAKTNAVNQYISNNGLKKYYFITPNNWNQMTGEIKNSINN